MTFNSLANFRHGIINHICCPKYHYVWQCMYCTKFSQHPKKHFSYLLCKRGVRKLKSGARIVNVRNFKTSAWQRVLHTAHVKSKILGRDSDLAAQIFEFVPFDVSMNKQFTLLKPENVVDDYHRIYNSLSL